MPELIVLRRCVLQQPQLYIIFTWVCAHISDMFNDALVSLVSVQVQFSHLGHGNLLDTLSQFHLLWQLHAEITGKTVRKLTSANICQTS